MNSPPANASTLPLEGYDSFHSTYFGELKDELCRTLAPHRLRQIDCDMPIDGRINRVYIGDIKVQAMHVGPAVEVLPVTLENSYMVHMPVHGKTGFEVGGRSFIAESNRAAILSPGVPLSSQWFKGCAAILISIDRRLLEFHFERFLSATPRSPIVFEPVLDLGSGHGRSWKQLWDYLLFQLQTQGRGAWSEKWGDDAVALIIDTLLLNTRHTYSESLRHCGRQAVPNYLRRAENFMYENAADPIRLEHVAQHAGVSTRTLRSAFVKYRGVPPIRALLNLRLDAVNLELQIGAGQETVTEVATRWGFRELGRFSVEYRRRFGETPSQTRGRPRRSS